MVLACESSKEAIIEGAKDYVNGMEGAKEGQERLYGRTWKEGEISGQINVVDKSHGEMKSAFGFYGSWRRKRNMALKK